MPTLHPERSGQILQGRTSWHFTDAHECAQSHSKSSACLLHENKAYLQAQEPEPTLWVSTSLAALYICIYVISM